MAGSGEQKRGYRELLLRNSQPEQDHQELLLALSKYQDGSLEALYYDVCKENCMIMYSHPMPIKGIGILSSQGECTIDLGEQETDPCYHLEAWLGKPFLLILAASDLTFCFSQQTLSRISPGPCPSHSGFDIHLRPLEQFLLPYCLKPSFKTVFFPSLLRKDKLC